MKHLLFSFLSSGKREIQLRMLLSDWSLGKSVDILLTKDRCVRAHSIEDGVSSGLVVLGCIRKQTE